MVPEQEQQATDKGGDAGTEAEQVQHRPGWRYPTLHGLFPFPHAPIVGLPPPPPVAY